MTWKHYRQYLPFLSKSKTQLVNQRKQKVAFSPGTAHSPEIQSYRTRWGAASPILNDTPVVCIYIYIIYIYIIYNIYINTELLDGNQGHQEVTHHPTHRFRRLFLDMLSMGWRGCASAMRAIKLPPSCSSPKIMCQSIHMIYYNMTMWILTGNYVSFTIAAGLIRLHRLYARCQDISCVTGANACHHALNDNHWHRLLEIPAIIGVKSNITIFNNVCIFFVNKFYCGRNRFNEFKHADMKNVG